MDAEALLRLTVLNLPSTPSPRTLTKGKSLSASPQPHIAESKGIHATFINLWIERLGHLDAIKAYLRNTLLFFLPGHWCCEPCETQHVALTEGEDTGGSPLTQYLEQSLAERPTKQGATKPFFAYLDALVSQLQPKAPHAQSSFQVWLKGVDKVLADTRALFTSLYSALFNSFCGVHQDLSTSYQRLAWEDVQLSYALAVCGLCHTVQARLLRVVVHAVSESFDACTANTRLVMFCAPASFTANGAADAVASVVQGRLGDITSSVMLNTSFADIFPKGAASYAVTKESHKELLAHLCHSISAYVGKLLAPSIEAVQPVPGVTESCCIPASESATLCSSDKATFTASPGKVEASSAALTPSSPNRLRVVSIEDAFELTALPEGAGIFSCVAELAAPIGDVEGSVQNLVEKQRKVMGVLLGGVPNGSTQPESWYDAHETCETTTSAAEDAPASPKRVPAAQKPSADHTEAVASYERNPKEALLFWHRLREALDLDEESITQAMSRCVFPNNSPYPNVFLNDLDLRNGDRATQLFLEEIRPLLSLKGAAAMKAVNARLFCEACAVYGEQLWERTLEIRESLPCLPLRVSGVLLGSMYPYMRTDKHFESLKQIYMQLCGVATQTGRTSRDAAILADIEVLLIKRAEALAHSVTAAASEQVEEMRTSLQSTVAASALRLGGESKAALTNAVNGTLLFNKVFCGTIGSSARVSENAAGLQMRLNRSTDAGSQGAALDEVAQSWNSPEKLSARGFSPGTPVADVYCQACLCHGVNPNLSLLHDLSISSADYFATLDLSSNYVGVKGLRPVLDLLQYNGEHLVSLSMCNNSLESGDVRDLCFILRGPPGKNLVHLDLSYNPFTNSAFPVLKELVASLTNLERLVMKGTLLFPNTARELQGILEERAIRRYSW
ncbi:hypothetical protein LSCM1_01419 [Leishmania martiniquensis]|uniref:Uncharacterized protein n=1 Tax=Leishmania martiniquensis TaxID=1580590 RepID=A0A836GFR9_9TRYP|nr:hypothetical protein LSCM1_01419 [Leishmania martiniquensis]